MAEFRRVRRVREGQEGPGRVAFGTVVPTLEIQAQGIPESSARTGRTGLLSVKTFNDSHSIPHSGL